MSEPTAVPHGWPRRRQTLGALLLFVALAVFHTWPLAAGLNTYSRHDNADAMLNEWAIAWIAHQLPRDPMKLFDANIFHPEPNTLAFSEHLFVQGVMGAPLMWLGVPSLVVHNLLVIAGFALTGWAMCIVIHRWTRDWWAATLAGLLLAFNAHSLARLAHLQAMHMEFLPFAMLALDRLLREPRAGHALRLAAAFSLQSLTSNYQLAYLTFGTVAAALARPAEWLRWSRRRTFGLLALSGAVSLAVLFPFLIHYLQAQRDQGLTRQLSEVARFAASWHDYLATGSRLHFDAWSAQFWRGSGAPLFPGFVAFLLSVVGVVWAIRGPHGRVVRMWLAMSVIGLVLSFGTTIPGYEYLYRAVPLLQGIRASVRFGRLFLAGVAGLAAFGLVVMRRDWLKTARARAFASAGILVLVTVEAARLPLGFSPHPPHRPPSIYKLLAGMPDAVVVEMPLYHPHLWQRNARYMLNSTLHWKPMLNGYSGFKPQSYDRHYVQLRHFPDDVSMAALRTIGVTHVVVSRALFVEEAGQEAFDRIDRTKALRLIARSGDVSIHLVEPAVR